MPWRRPHAQPFSWRMARRLRTAGAVYWFVLALAVGLIINRSSAQEPSAYQAMAAMENVLVDVIAKNQKSVVAIARVARGPNEVRQDGAGAPRIPTLAVPLDPSDPDFIPNSYGTGVVVDRRGLILTEYHVLGENSDLWVTTSDHRTLPARIKAADPRSDLAILEVEASDLTPITLGNANALKQGQIVIALGNPYAIARDGQASASWGIIANLGRKAGPAVQEGAGNGKEKLYNFGTLIQTDAKLNAGASGGALLNLKGEMIGLTTALASTPGYEQAAGYAIPVEEAFRRAVDTLKQGREVEYGFLGVLPGNLTDLDVRRGLRGARVKEVVFGTPAYRFDLRPADVITHVNSRPVLDADGLVLNLSKLPVEAPVKLTVDRDGQVLQMNVSLTKSPVRGKKIVTSLPPAWRGLSVDYVTAMPQEEFLHRADTREIDPEGCVLITDVEKGSPAEAAGLKSDLLITRVGNTPVKSPQEFRAAVAGADGPVRITIHSLNDMRQAVDRPVNVAPPAN